MKRVLQELFDLRNKSFDAMKFVKFFDENKTQLLEKEKQQIIDARMNGVNAALSFGKAHREPSEEYYNETFKQE